MNNYDVEYILAETASIYAKSEVRKIKDLKFHTSRISIKNICDLLISYIENYKKIFDKTDLEVFRQSLSIISEFVNILFSASDKEKINWELPLINECYRLSSIDFSKREVFIINSTSVDDYKIYYNITRYLFKIIPQKEIKKPIDVFVIPREVDYDITSISLIGHEIGHLILSLNFEEADVEKLVLKFTGDDQKTFDSYDEIQKTSKYIREYLCDKIGEFLFGPVFDIALIKNFCSIPKKKDEFGDEHPCENSRIEKSFENIKNFKSNEEDINQSFISIKESLNIFLYNVESIYPKTDIKSFKLEQMEMITETIYKRIKQKLISSVNIDKNWIKIRSELDSFLPPFEEVNDKIPNIFTPLEIVIAISIYFSGNIFKNKNEYFMYSKKDEDEKINIIKETLIKHMKYAVGLFNVVKVANKNYSKINIEETGLSGTLWQFRKRVTGEKPSPIIVVPTIDPLSQYSQNSIDLRLGTSFLIHKSTRYAHIDPLGINKNKIIANH